MINKIITLENQEKYYLVLEKSFDNDKFYVGVKLLENKWTNEFKVFLEKKKDEDIFLELIDDEKILKVIVNDFLLENIN